MSHPDPTARALIQRLADSVELLLQMRNGLMPLGITEMALAEARAYLAASGGPAAPTDAELLELMPETMQDEFAACASTYSAATGGQVEPGLFRKCLNTAALEYARAVLARWGADQELEACCEWLQDPDLNVDTYKLRAARRPKPPSLKEQALEAHQRMWNVAATREDHELVRRALEQLDD